MNHSKKTIKSAYEPMVDYQNITLCNSRRGILQRVARAMRIGPKLHLVSHVRKLLNIFDIEMMVFVSCYKLKID